MALLTNGSAIQARFLAGSLLALAPMNGAEARRRYFNAAAFGSDASWPQGYQAVTRAAVPPLVTGGQMAVRAGFALDLAGFLTAAANMEASAALDLDMTADANARSNAYATVSFSLDMTAGLRATANLSAVFDLVGRPSAVDIAQEVWGGFVVENGLSPAEVLRVLLAVAAGKTTIAGTGPTVVTFRDQADAIDRVRAEMTGSERDAVTIDGGA